MTLAQFVISTPAAGVGVNCANASTKQSSTKTGPAQFEIARSEELAGTTPKVSPRTTTDAFAGMFWMYELPNRGGLPATVGSRATVSALPRISIELYCPGRTRMTSPLAALMMARFASV